MSKLEYQEKDEKVYCPLKNKWLISTPEEKSDNDISVHS